MEHVSEALSKVVPIRSAQNTRGSTEETRNECPKCHDRWGWKNPVSTSWRDRIIRCDCPGAVAFWQKHDRELEERREAARREEEEEAWRQAERAARCEKCGGDGYWYNVLGEPLPCSCLYGMQVRVDELDDTLPLRFTGARLADFPSAVVSEVELTAFEEGEGLLIHGPVGTGKTRLAIATMYYLATKYLPCNMLFVSVPELLAEIRASFSPETKCDRHLQERALEVSVLVLDDFGTERVTDWVRETQYMIINRRYNYRLPIICTTNLSPSKLAAHIGDRCASRLVEMCRVIKLAGEDRRLKSWDHR